MNATKLASQLTVRYRHPGILCLDLPKALCLPTVTAGIEAGMSTLVGLRETRLDVAARCITLRYDNAQMSTAQLARHLFAVLNALPETGVPEPSAAVAAAQPSLGLQPVLDKLRGVLIPPGEPEPGSLQARFQPLVESALTEKAVTNFFNDIVAFYLIKVHWDVITRRWLQHPLAHGNAWLATFYLVFLLVRYRKSP